MTGPSRLWIFTISCTEERENVLFNDALDTFYLRLYGVRHMVKEEDQVIVTSCIYLVLTPNSQSVFMLGCHLTFIHSFLVRYRKVCQLQQLGICQVFL